MSEDKFKQFEIIIIGGAVIVGGIIIYKLITEDGPVKDTLDQLLGVSKSITDIYVTPDAETLSIGQTCVRQHQCSMTGTAGGKSVGVYNPLIQTNIGCCDNKCALKKTLSSGMKVCDAPDPAGTIFGGLNEPATSNGNCSKTGFAGLEKTSEGNNPLNISNCSGMCKIMLLPNGQRAPPNTPLDALTCPDPNAPAQTVIPKVNDTKALGASCTVTSDCSSTGLYGDVSSDGSTGIGCIKNLCSKTSALNGRCNNVSDCSANEVSGGPSASANDNITCSNFTCKRKTQL